MEIVSFEIAKKLKEKGFDEVCYNYYEPLKHCLNQIKTPWTNKDGESYGVITAPTLSQVLKWLREEKKLHISIEYGYAEIPIWDFEIRLIGNYGRWWTDETYSSYELAALAGVNYCLDNLI